MHEKLRIAESASRIRNLNLGEASDCAGINRPEKEASREGPPFLLNRYVTEDELHVLRRSDHQPKLLTQQDFGKFI